MVGITDLLERLRRGSAKSKPRKRSIDDPAIANMACEARSDTVTRAVLANEHGRSKYPIVRYLDESEQVDYVIRGTELVIDDGDSYTRDFSSREIQIVISADRLLVLQGRRLTDDLWEIPLSDVVDVYVDATIPRRRYFVVDADRTDKLVTFFVDVSVEPRGEDVRSAVEFVLDRAGIDGEPVIERDET